MIIHRSTARRAAGALMAGLLALGTLTVGAVTTHTPAQAANAKTLTIALTQEVDTLNPFRALYRSSTQIGRLMYDFLTAYDPLDGHPVPGLATKWTTSSDKLTWTYTIRKDAKWSDGKPVTAKDVAFTYNLIMKDPDIGDEANGSFVTNFSSVTATGDTTLVIKTKAPQATMLALDIPIVPQHTWKNVKISSLGKFGNDQDPVSGGPFLLTDYKEGQYVKFRANPTYWRGKAKIDTLVFQEYKNSDAAVQALRKGEVDMVNGLTTAQVNTLKKTKNVTVNEAHGKRFYELSMNPGAKNTAGKPVGNGNPALADVKVRQAIDTAIDKKTLVSRVLGGYGTVGTGYVPPVYPIYHWSPPASDQRTFSISKANKMLDDAGYQRGSGGIRQMPGGGKALKFRLTTHSDVADDHPVAQYVTGWLKQLGITVSEQVESDTKLNDDLKKGDYDMIAGGWTVNPDPDYVLALQVCSARPDAKGTAGSTDDFWCDKGYDKLYAKQLSTFDQTQRADDVKQMQQIFYQQVPSVVMYYPDELEAYRSDRFGDFVKMPGAQGQILNQDGFWGIYSATPASSSGSGGGSNGDSGGGNGTLIAVIVVVVVVLAAGGGFVAFRRRRTAAERE